MRRLALVLVLALAVALVGPAVAAPDLAAMNRELTQTRNVGGTFKVAMWMPTEYILATASQLTDAGREQVRKSFGRYALFVYGSGRTGPGGTIEAVPATLLVATLALRIDDGPSLRPVPEEALPNEFRDVLGAMRPAFRRMLGQLGSAIEIAVFEVPEPIDPLRDGRLRLDLANETFAWRLPLGSLMPPTADPDSGERFPGNYRFNPYTGKKLEIAP